jgi:mono/diheme cytochrome c family protein
MRAHSFIVVAVLAGAALAGCANEAPAFPTYSHDVKPIMEAHCIRCHGAGGKLNMDVYEAPVLKSPTNTKALQGDFTRLDDANGIFGLLHYTAGGAAGLHLYVDTGPMPPPPAPALTNYEYDTLFTWATEPTPLP